MTVHKLLECYNVTQEDQDDEDPQECSSTGNRRRVNGRSPRDGIKTL
jgi:hypothetical protein